MCLLDGLLFGIFLLSPQWFILVVFRTLQSLKKALDRSFVNMDVQKISNLSEQNVAFTHGFFAGFESLHLFPSPTMNQLSDELQREIILLSSNKAHCDILRHDDIMQSVWKLLHILCCWQIKFCRFNPPQASCIFPVTRRWSSRIHCFLVWPCSWWTRSLTLWKGSSTCWSKASWRCWRTWRCTCTTCRSNNHQQHQTSWSSN